MTSLHLRNVATAIAALEIEGVTVKDLDQIPNTIEDRELPVLAPSSHEPAFLTDWEQEQISLARNRQTSYTLNYKLFQVPAGKERGLMKTYPGMVETAEAVADAFMALTNVPGCKYLTLSAMPQFGPVVDASGKLFHGAVISLRVTEF